MHKKSSCNKNCHKGIRFPFRETQPPSWQPLTHRSKNVPKLILPLLRARSTFRRAQNQNSRETTMGCTSGKNRPSTEEHMYSTIFQKIPQRKNSFKIFRHNFQNMIHEKHSILKKSYLGHSKRPIPGYAGTCEKSFQSFLRDACENISVCPILALNHSPVLTPKLRRRNFHHFHAHTKQTSTKYKMRQTVKPTILPIFNIKPALPGPA